MYTMKMTFRWYGSKFDPIPLKYVKQIAGMTGLMGLLDKPAGVVWEDAEIAALVNEVHEAGLELEVIESVNVHEDIKTGLGRRDEYIDHYISTAHSYGYGTVVMLVKRILGILRKCGTDL